MTSDSNTAPAAAGAFGAPGDRPWDASRPEVVIPRAFWGVLTMGLDIPEPS